ncbi:MULTISPECIES: hypothetical protein [Alphaproteobacteria]|uniref:Uncharacterized protein n=2 Tax=Alphaproteobacteria TaxID=28211 RepID=A0A9W7NIG9_9PROT|nr:MULTISPECIES: hypothetical protein [Rhodospirillales]KAA0679571.1 hypothetical protein DS843_16695 [Roseomonas genomospecies 6]KAA0686205.1 hypothetical protein DS837_10940 [Azospirillum brasilense]
MAQDRFRAKSATVTVTREGQAVGAASGPDGGWCIVATRRPLLERLHTVQKEILEEAAAKPVRTAPRPAAPRISARPRFGKRSFWF